MLALEGLKLSHERIERRIGNLGVVEKVVPVFVPPDLYAQRFDAVSEGHERKPLPAAS